MGGLTLAPSIHEAEVTHHRAPARARDLLSVAAGEMHHTVGPDPALGLCRALHHDAAGPAPTPVALAAVQSADQPLDRSPLHVEGRSQLLGEAVATRDHLLDQPPLLVESRQLEAQDGTLQHQRLLHLAVVVKSLFLDLVRALLDLAMTPGVEVTRGLPLLAADERMYHCQRFFSFRPTA